MYVADRSTIQAGNFVEVIVLSAYFSSLDVDL